MYPDPVHPADATGAARTDVARSRWRAASTANADRFVTTNFVAEMFSVTNETVRDWIAQGLLEAIKVNRSWRIKYSSVVVLANSRYGGTA